MSTLFVEFVGYRASLRNSRFPEPPDDDDPPGEDPPGMARF
jgi:hypothetical protein